MIRHNTLPQFPAQNYLNRELGLLAFNRRVLAQKLKMSAYRCSERLRFCASSPAISTNFLKFAWLASRSRSRPKRGFSRRTARQRWKPITWYRLKPTPLLMNSTSNLNDVILPALAEVGIRFLKRSKWNEAQREWIRQYFIHEMVPVLTPIGLDPSHPFPKSSQQESEFCRRTGRQGCLRAQLQCGHCPGTASIAARHPATGRVGRLRLRFRIPLVDPAPEFVDELFTGMTVLGCYQFRATRNSDLFVDEEEVTNLRTKLQGELPHRRFGDAVRLEIAENCSPAMTDFLLTQFGLTHSDLYRVEGPVNQVLN